MKYYIIAGEASGDLHGSHLIEELKKLDTSSIIRCWGGDKMQAAGGTLVKHIRELAFMGFAEVLMNLRTIFRNLKFCKEDILRFQPDVLILIDYPGFNLRIAKWARQQGIKVVYYISPQVWAWKESRVKLMKRCIDKMLVIFPFEKDYFKTKWNWDVEYVGHPLIQEIENYKAGFERRKSGINDLFSGRPGTEFMAQNAGLIALLPGSRKQEILKKLPVMLEVSSSFPEYQFVVAKAPGVDDEFYSALLKPYKNVSSVSGKTYDLLMQAKAALVASGTATLETALFEVPEAVCYKSSFFSYEIGKRLVKVKYIAIVNIILNKPVVKEFIQHDLTAENLKNELKELLTNDARIAAMKKDFATLKKLLSEQGHASANAARSVFLFLNAAATSLQE